MTVTAPAFAQDRALIERLKELDRQAIADYAADDHESARLGLREAITLAGKGGLGADPMMALLWADLGALYINGLKDKVKGAKALGVALKINPDVLPSEPMRTPEVKAVIAELTGGPAAAPPVAAPTLPAPAPPATAPPIAAAPPAEPAAPPPAPKPPKRKRGAGTEPDLPANIPTPLYCPTVDEAPPEENVVLNCVLAPDVTAKKVTLFYRTAGDETWSSAPTKISELGWVKAVVPGEAVRGKSVQYYLEARDAADKSVAKAGRDDSPNLLLVRDGASSLSGGVWAGMQAARGDGGAGEMSDEDPLLAVARQRERERSAHGLHRRGARSFYVGLSGGSGYGWHPEGRLEFYDDAQIAAGWIPSGLLHFVPTIGYQVTDKIAVALEARVQYIQPTGSGDAKPGSPARGAFLVLGRLQYFIGEGNFQGTASLLVGAGDGFRLTVGPQTQVDQKYRRNDSVRGGPLAGGAGLGVIYHVSPHVGLVVDGRVLAGYPSTAMVFDATGGLNLAF